jgi:transcription initiation factor IIE alpha subunit
MKNISNVYVVDLTKIDGDGDFQCPKCGSTVSPEDETETTYVIQEVKMKQDGQLEELVIKCNNCESIIHITGFTSL